MKFRLPTSDDSGQPVIREMDFESEDEARAFAALEGIELSSVESLQGEPRTDQETRAHQTTCLTPVSPVPAGAEAQWAKPRFLFDPLREMRQIVLYFLIPVTLLQLLVSVLAFARVLPSDTCLTLVAVDVRYWPLLLSMIPVLLLLPRNRPDVLYLRSFRLDDGNTELTDKLQHALGSSVRITGIRSPRVRMPLVLRYLAMIVFVLRYTNGRHQNLEAGPDWKRRLYHTINQARGIVLDLRDMTHYVRFEINLSYWTVGLPRILFVGDPSKSIDEWRQSVIDSLTHYAEYYQFALPAIDRESLRVVLWRNGSFDCPGDVTVAAGVLTQPRAAVTTSADHGVATSLVSQSDLPVPTDNRFTSSFFEFMVAALIGPCVALTITGLGVVGGKVPGRFGGVVVLLTVLVSVVFILIPYLYILLTETAEAVIRGPARRRWCAVAILAFQSFWLLYPLARLR
jgi:hypothetical protein